MSSTARPFCESPEFSAICNTAPLRVEAMLPLVILPLPKPFEPLFMSFPRSNRLLRFSRLFLSSGVSATEREPRYTPSFCSSSSSLSLEVLVPPITPCTLPLWTLFNPFLILLVCNWRQVSTSKLWHQ